MPKRMQRINGILTPILADGSVTSISISDDSITSLDIKDLEITNADVNASANISHSKLESVVVATDQANVFGDFAQTFQDGQVRLRNPADTFEYAIDTLAIAADRMIILPLLTGNATFTFDNNVQTLTNKTLTGAVGVTAITGVGVQAQTLDMGTQLIDNVSRIAVTSIANETNTDVGITFLAGATVRIDTLFQLGEAVNMNIGTTTGSKFGTTTSSKIGFWNVTPVTQPAGTGETTGHAAVGGTNVNSNDTFTGNTGSKAYTINDVVKALKNSGLMAAS